MASKFSQKHYVEIARMFAELKRDLLPAEVPSRLEGYEAVQRAMSRMFSRDSDSYDSSRFMEACGEYKP